jgi:DNA-binding response OmpR family regulator
MHVLLIEDNPDDEELTRLAFEQSGITNKLDVVRDGAEALDYLFASGTWTGRAGGNPSLVLLDLKLPKIGGLDVLRRLRAESSTRLIPVVILTSSVEEQDVISGYNLGCNSYIRKPVDFSQFAAAVRTLGLYWMVLNEPPKTERAA